MNHGTKRKSAGNPAFKKLGRTAEIKVRMTPANKKRHADLKSKVEAMLGYDRDGMTWIAYLNYVAFEEIETKYAGKDASQESGTFEVTT